MSKISPCLWFATEAEEAANFYVSLLPDSRIDHVQRNVSDSPGGKKGTVLVVDFTLAGQRFMALNGGRKFEYTHAISFHIDCNVRRRRGRALRLAQGPLRPVLADRPDRASQAARRPRSGQGATGHAGHAADGQD